MRKLKDKQKRRQRKIEARNQRAVANKAQAKESHKTDSDTGYERISSLINRFTKHLGAVK
jgi:hypothetical protein